MSRPSVMPMSEVEVLAVQRRLHYSVSGSVKTVEISRFENQVFRVDGAEVLRGLVLEG